MRGIGAFGRWVAAFVLGLGIAMCAPTAHAQLAGQAQAQARFARGRQLFVQQDYANALIEFRAAISLVGSPNTRLYIARCLHGLGRNAEAYVEFERTAAEASDRAATEPRYAVTRDTAHHEGEALAPLLGQLTVQVPNAPDGVTVTVGGAPVASGGWGVEAPFDPGPVRVHATAPGRITFDREVRVEAGHGVQVTVELPVDPNAQRAAAQVQAPPPRPQHVEPVVRHERVGGSVRVAGYVVAVLGAGGLIAGGVLYALAWNRFQQLQNQCPGPSGCDPSMNPAIDEGERWQTMSWVAASAGAGVLLIGAVLIAVGGPHDEAHVVSPGDGAPSAHTRRDTPRRWAVWGTPLVGAAGGIVGVGGRF